MFGASRVPSCTLSSTSAQLPAQHLQQAAAAAGPEHRSFLRDAREECFYLYTQKSCVSHPFLPTGHPPKPLPHTNRQTYKGVNLGRGAVLMMEVSRRLSRRALPAGSSTYSTARQHSTPALAVRLPAVGVAAICGRSRNPAFAARIRTTSCGGGGGRSPNPH